jgi:biotin/methionine sulfoxide reductase
MAYPSNSRRTATHWGVYELDESAPAAALRPSRDDPDPAAISDPLAGSAGRILGPAVRLGYLRHGPRRVANRRGAEPFVEVDWDDALDLAAAQLAHVRAAGGNDAIYAGSYGWASAGRFHHAQSQVHRFLRCFGGYTDSVDSYSFAVGEVLLPHVLGQTTDEHHASLPTWHELAESTDLVLAFGGLPLRNTQVNAGGVGRHLAKEGQLAAGSAGVRFVSVSPIRDDCAGFLGARWVGLRPGTDTALMLALAHTIIAAGLHDAEFLDRCCVGFPALRRYIDGGADGIAKDADWAAAIADVPADVIRQLALEVATHRTLITVAWALQRAHHGEQPVWMALALAAISGQLGRRGGGFGFGYSIEQNGSATGRSRVAALPQPPNAVSTRIPVARISDLLLRPGETIDYNGTRVTFPRIDLVYWCGGNPFHHHQDLNRLRRAWQQPETVIVHEPYWNALAKHADIVFPCTTTVEREDFAAGGRDRHLTAMHRIVEPAGSARDDYAIFAALAARLGIEERFTEGRSVRQWIEHLYTRTREYAQAQGADLPEFDAFWEIGEAVLPVPAGSREWPLARFREDPGTNALATPSGRVELFSERIAGFNYEDCPGHPVWLEPIEWLGGGAAARFPLHILSNQPRARLHSQLDHAGSSQATKVGGREPVRIHPKAAAARSISAGDVVRLHNDRGSCLAGAVITDDVRPDVVQLSTGAWYDAVDPADSVSLESHGNPNVLTRDIGTSRLAQGPSAQTALVELERLRGSAPPVRAFDRPAFVSPGPGR